MEIKLNAAAKVNLILDLTSVLENGYHSIFTVMQSVGIFDSVSIRTSDSKEISIGCSDKAVPTDKTNTAYKAAEEFFKYTSLSNPGTEIFIDKNIPSQAGMAGGSADAAAVIKGLDRLFNTELTERELFSIGEKIGADVPFCIAGGTRLCLNKGEVMAQLPDLPDCNFVIVKPDQGISTKNAYSDFDSSEWIRHPDNDGFLFAATTKDLKTMCKKAANVFEQVVEVVDRVRIKSVMRNNGAILSLMTGSGAAVFGIFENEKSAKECEKDLSSDFSKVFLTKPLTQGLYIL